MVSTCLSFTGKLFVNKTSIFPGDVPVCFIKTDDVYVFEFLVSASSESLENSKGAEVRLIYFHTGFFSRMERAQCFQNLKILSLHAPERSGRVFCI